MTTNADCRVAVIHDAALAYPLAPPFDPPDPVYDAVLGLLERLGLDPDHAGTPEWNPLGEFVGPGQHVVITTTATPVSLRSTTRGGGTSTRSATPCSPRTCCSACPR